MRSSVVKRLPAVAVTGWAWRTPLGDAVDAVVARLLAGERAGVATETEAGRVFAPVAARPRVTVGAAGLRADRFLDRLGRLALEVAQEALPAAPAPERLGLFSAVPGLRLAWDELAPAAVAIGDDESALWERGLRGLHPFWLLRHLSNNVHAVAAATLQARGDGATFGGCCAGVQALAAAQAALREGAIDVAVVVAHDSLLAPDAIARLARDEALWAGADPDAVTPPYDESAAGVVPGEAAAAVALERADEARGRALVRLCATAGSGAPGLPEPALMTRTAARLTSGGGALAVDGGGWARPAFDAAERRALADLAGADAPLCAVTAHFGQLGAATGVVQAIALGTCLRAGRLPPLPRLVRPAPGPLRPVAAPGASAPPAALALSCGAPGQIGALLLEAA